MKRQRKEKDVQPTSVQPMTALRQLPIPAASSPEGIREGSNLSGGGIPIPSGEAFALRYLRIWTRRLMIVCAVLIVCCVTAVPLLSRLKVKRVIVEGCAHYDAQYLTEESGVAVGDGLLLCAPGDVQRTLMEKCPYLLSVSVERKMTGEVLISVAERRPLFALMISSDEVALLDETMRVLEICAASDCDASLYRVQMELFSDGSQTGGITPGQTYAKNAAALEKLTLLFDALGEQADVSVRCVDLRDLYAVTVALTDGTVFALHDCSAPEKQLRTAAGALLAYRNKTGYTAPVVVDVDASGRVFVSELSENKD